MKRTLLWAAGACMCAAPAWAAQVIGVVKDKQTGAVLIGSTVEVKEQPNLKVTSGLDGSFVIKDVDGLQRVTLVCHYLGYQPTEVSVSPDAAAPTVIELESKGTALGGVTVMGTRVGNTERSARQIEMKSLNVMNVMSAQAIRLSPDIDVAGVIQRMSGVVMESGSAGEGKYAILRGMDKRYNYSLVNGIKIASPDNKDRYVPLDLFPAELMDRLEVTKSLTADMEGDATGGVINMVMKDAPTHAVVEANAAVGYNSLLWKRQLATAANDITPCAPREAHGATYKATMADFSTATSRISYTHPLPNLWAGMTAGRRFLGNRLGVMAAGSYENMNRATNSLFFEDAMNQNESTIYLTEAKRRRYSEQLQRGGAHLKLDFIPTIDHKIEWYNAFLGSRSDQVRESTGTDLKYNYAPERGNLLQNLQTRSRRTVQTVFSSMLKGHHELPAHVEVDWTGAFGRATGKQPDNTYIGLERSVVNHVATVTADPDATERRWEHNNDRDWTGKLDVRWHNDGASGRWEVKAGGLYRNKRRENRYVSYSFRTAGTTRPVQGQDFQTLDQIPWVVSTPYGSVNALNYNAGEDVGAAYAMARFENSRWSVTLGLRAEHTDQSYRMIYPSKNVDEPAEGHQRYWDALPSAHIKYTIEKSRGLYARLSYFRSINRPGFFEIVPYTIINEDYTEYGNNKLKRARIDNVDLRLEWLPNATDQVLLGLFYKHIQNPIEYAYYTRNNRQFGYGPANLGNADNCGLELDVTKYFHQFGIKANYTYTYSTISTPKTRYYRDAAGTLRREEKQQRRTLVGQAPHVANLSLIYRDASTNGWEAQLTGSYISERLAVASHYYRSDYYDAPQFTLGCSVEKNWGHWTLFAKGTNLLNTKRERYVKTVNAKNEGLPGQDLKGKTLIRRDRSGVEMLLGVRFKL